jgi:hypothetical protein
MAPVFVLQPRRRFDHPRGAKPAEEDAASEN